METVIEMEAILLIPAEFRECPFAPIYKIERRLTCNQVKQYIERDKAACGLPDIDHALDVDMLAELLYKKDTRTLSKMIAAIFTETIAVLDLTANSDLLYQAVEIDWTLRDLHTIDYPIHYEIFTKREVLR